MIHALVEVERNIKNAMVDNKRRKIESILENALEQMSAGHSASYVYHYTPHVPNDWSMEYFQNTLERLSMKKELKEKKEAIIKELKEKDILTAELELQIKNAFNFIDLEDIYLPHKHGKQTAATQAKKNGLEEFANWIWEVGHQTEPSPDTPSLEEKAKEFIKEDDPSKDEKFVINGAQSIIVERIAETTKLRAAVRENVMQKSILTTTKGTRTKIKSKYTRFYNYKESMASIKSTGGSQRYLTILKGVDSNELMVRVESTNKKNHLKLFEDFACSKSGSPVDEFLLNAARLSLNGNVYTAIEHEASKYLKDKAERKIKQTLLSGLTYRLSQPQLGKYCVLGIELNNKNFLSIALISEKGELLAHNTFPNKTDEDWEKIQKELGENLDKIKIAAIAVNHESKEKIGIRRIKRVLAEKKMSIPLITIYDQAITTYSTSSTARKEHPDKDPDVRQAIFLAKYLQSPLESLLKLDTKFLLTSSFSLKMNQEKLTKSIHQTIQNAVCEAGANINEASSALLSYLPGLNRKLSDEIVEHREKNGNFSTIEELKNISFITDSLYQDIAGFITSDAPNPLEQTRIHPDHFSLIEDNKIPETPEIKEKLGERYLSLIKRELERISNSENTYKFPEQKNEFISLDDIDMKEEYIGTVTNITNFGIFVDLGQELDGLIHISEILYTSSAYEIATVGKKIKVWINNIDKEKQQISLTLKTPEERERLASIRKKKRAYAPRNPQPDNRKKEFFKPKDTKPKETEKPKMEPRKKRPPKRDTKTGAILKEDTNIYTSQRRGDQQKKFATKAKAATFNPFADLNALLKNKKEE